MMTNLKPTMFGGKGDWGRGEGGWDKSCKNSGKSIIDSRTSDDDFSSKTEITDNTTVCDNF